jgi:phenylalanyl-tRNA synthetase alpha chain
MSQEPEKLQQEALKELADISSAGALEAWRVRYLGRKGELTTVLRSLGAMSPEERRTVGASANKVKNSLERNLKEKEQAIKESQMAVADTEALDITLPGRPFPEGKLHPITQSVYEICDIFSSMGFNVLEGPEAEWDYYNFEALNIPEEHPSRDSMSTFWIDYENEKGEKPMLMRTHNTAVSARSVEAFDPPIRVVEPGKVYRYEATDATHGWMLYQIDGIAVDKGITMADLKGTLYEFARRFFGEDRKVRFRPDYFPFVEPGVDMSVDCIICGGAGCRICGNSGWIEILGAGMTHPDVLRRGGIDSDEYTSFAFGMGIDRVTMLRTGISDGRLYYGSDLRFLRQF